MENRNRALLKLLRSIILVLACFLCLSQSGFSGELSDFEQDATRNEDNNKTENNDHYYHEHHGFWYSFFDVLFDTVIVGGGEMSRHRVKGTPYQYAEFLKPRQLGEALIPFFRADGEYQNVIGDISAYSLRAEGGYGAWGIQARNTHYKEKNPADNLDYLQVYGLYRMSFGNHVEIDLGLGSSTLSGRERNSGTSFTMPILVHPNNLIGFELRPSWTDINGSGVSDWDFSMDLNYRFTALRIGYRWVRSEHEGLNGPYIGVSFRF
jgi:hypothetical protein